MTELSLGNGFYKSVAPIASNQECVNFRPKYILTPSGVTQVFLLETEGLTTIASSEEGELNRGAIPFLGSPYFVQGSTLYRLNRSAISGGGFDYELIDLGTITGTGPVFMAINPTQICIVVPGGDVYIFSETGGLVLIVDPEFLGPATGVIFVNGHFIFWTAQIMFSSGINDGLSYNGADFVGAEALPDEIVGCFPYDNNIMVFGQDITERFQYTADDFGFPFTRIEGAYLQKGMISPFGVTETDDTLIFIGGSPTEMPSVWQSDGNNVWNISTPSIEDRIQSYIGREGVFEDAFFVTYGIEDSVVACLNLGGDSLCFDVIASRAAERPIWHRRDTLDNGAFGQWGIRSIIKNWNQILTAGTFTNLISIMSNDVFDENGVDKIRVWASENMYNNGNPIYVNRVEVVVDAEITEYDTDFTLGLRYSEDGGRTFGVEEFRTVGTVGQFDGRIVWDRLGRFDTMVMFQLRWVNNARMTVIRFTVYEELQ